MGSECSTSKICDPDKMFDFDTQNKEVEKMKQHKQHAPFPGYDVHSQGHYDQPHWDPPTWRPPQTAAPPIHHSRHGEQHSPAQKRQFRVHRLMLAAEEGQFLAIDQVLSEALANQENIVNEVDDMNDTALHKAARKGHVMACRSLLQHGAQVYRNGQGRTPYEVAVANHRTDCMAFLQLVDKIARAEDEREAVPVVVQSSSEPLINYEKNSEASFKLDNKLASVNESFSTVPADGGFLQPPEPEAPRRAADAVPKLTTAETLKAAAPSLGPQSSEGGGVAVVALYDFVGSSTPPFSNDPRLEATMKQGDVFFLLRMRADGWCIVQRSQRGEEFYVPGNFVSMNGVEPLVIEEDSFS